MMSCPTDDVLRRFADVTLSAEQTERLAAHLAHCERCRAEDARLRILIGDVKAPFPEQVDIQAHVQSVMARLDQPSVKKPPRPALRRVFAGAGFAATFAAAAYLLLQTPERSGLQARGGAAEGSLSRNVSLRPCAVKGGLEVLEPGAIIDGATPLTATYRNLRDAPAFLLLFAVDAHHVVHWIAPRYARLEDNPISAALAVSDREQVLDTTVVLDDLSPGPLRLVAVITPAPLHVSVVESLEGTEMDTTRLARLFPAGADVRETVVEVRDTDGGAR